MNRRARPATKRRIDSYRLATATPTTATITSREMRAAINETTSFKTTVVVAAMFGLESTIQIFNLVVRNARHPLFSDAQSDLGVLLLVLCAVMAVWYSALAIRKSRQEQAAT